MMSHFDEMTVLLYLDGQMGAEEEREISDHLSSCDECRHLLQVLQKENIWLRQALATEEEVLPARLSAAPGYADAQFPWGWLAGMGVAAAGIYTLWSGIVDPWLTQASDAGFNQGNVLTMLFFSGAFWKGWDAMQSMIEFLSMASVAVAVIWLLRRRWRRLTVAAALLAAGLGMLMLSPAASAADVYQGDPNYTLEAGKEVHTDLIVTAQHTRIDGDVDGDLIAFSRSITVNGHVKGDILAFAQEVHVNGPVDGNIRTFAQALDLNGTVGKNVMVWAREFDMDEKARVGGTMTLGSADSQLDGQVNGDLLAFVETLDMNGTLRGNAMIRGQRLRIGPNADIKGQIKYRGGRPPVTAGAKVASPIEILSRGPVRANYASPRYYWRQVLSWGAALVFGILLFVIAPALFKEVETAAGTRFGLSLGVGLLFLVATPVAAVIACFTIIGLGVGISTLLLYVLAIYAAQTFIGEWLGEKMLGPAAGTGAAIARLALGLAVIHLVRMVPFAGRLVGFTVLLWGLGALVLAIQRRLRPQFATAV
jgi:cytoskeletal protein CcmA (bactofilin family)